LKLNSNFIILWLMAALTVLNPEAPALDPGVGAHGPLPTAVPRPMTRCECADVAFAEVARQVFVEGRALPDVLRRTACGQNCSACLPDLLRHLAHRR
jgi:NAD(P)H-nitrite reductase large subunit